MYAPGARCRRRGAAGRRGAIRRHATAQELSRARARTPSCARARPAHVHEPPITRMKTAGASSLRGLHSPPPPSPFYRRHSPTPARGRRRVPRARLTALVEPVIARAALAPRCMYAPGAPGAGVVV
ncbi:hypothetical protein HYPSUDRAFT_210466 [Hypholoma sublateritium FD-334 SS-4]|uniref:Uncharacterized protein n=1 Tax=Hypholoma sublateritium (strain FD-334 SS-4) TaxID=945553 RepID=A0A0D2LN59_HYPSF|nr:hypothetical protein HYPSUDRAFT_210466 [Hypholoma sublateritium FD-334 SS-4]